MMYALCDCNNFFVSCERLFRPELEHRPVVVLSGNDGCVVARSEEAKKVGIKMGEPFFQVQDVAKKHGVVAFSSNFYLYGDLSNRVMRLLAQHTPVLEQYSIDEAFLQVDHIPIDQLKNYFEQVVRTIRQWVGIPVSIGIAPTKTLAKVASKYAKRYPAYHGVCLMDDGAKRAKALETFPIKDVWGIGRQTTMRLEKEGITTAWQFAQTSSALVKRWLHKPGWMTWQELNGIDCVDIANHVEHQTISQTRTFQTTISDRATMEKVWTDFMVHCANKLRQQASVCNQFVFFAHTSRFQNDMQVLHQVVTLPVATDVTTELVTHLLQVIRHQWRSYPYKRAGVVLTSIMPKHGIQQALFDERCRERDQRLQHVMDTIHQHHGAQVLQLGAQVLPSDTPKITKQEHRSPRYTTHISEVLILKV